MGKKEKVQIEVEVPATLNVKHAACPKGHSLIDEKVKIHGYPSLKVKVRFKKQEGYIYLDPIYGSFDNIFEGITLKKSDVVEFFCPVCGVSLKDPNEICQLCSSPMFVFHLPKGGIIEGCLKNGCLFHKMKIVDAEQQFARLYENKGLESFL